MIEHYIQNKETFDHWIKVHERLQISNDIFKPLIKPFMAANPNVNLNGCQDCIIDMLVWVRAEWKKTTEDKPKKK